MIRILSFIKGLFLLKHFRLYSTIFFLSIGLICGCSYEPLAPPEMPTYYQTINLPLADVSLPLADLVNPDNNIYGDSTKDQLYFQFSGNLDTVTLTETVFQIPTVGNVNFSQNFSELSESQLTFSRSVTQTTKLSEIITIPGTLPSPNELLIGEIARYELDGQRYKYRVFDKDDVPYFERVDYLTVGSGTFQTEIDNQLPVAMDSVRITLRNKNGSLIAESFYENVPAGATLRDGTPGNLNGAQLFDSIEVIVTAVMAGSQGQPVTIPANTDPFIAIKFDTNIEEIESFTGIPKPIVTTQNQLLPPSNNTIFKATIAQTTTSPLDTNFLDLTIHNLMPFNLRMQVIFHNFYIRNEPLTIDTIVQSGLTVENPARLDGYIFRNPDPTTVVDSFLVEIIATILPNAGEQVVTIPTDMGDASIDVNLYFARLKFDMLEGFFNESFDIPPMAIANIPTGLANVDFGQVFLKLTFFNEIQARTNVNLVLRGLKKGVAPQTITEDGSIAKASPANPIQESTMEIDIAPIFNMVPDSILVSGQAIIPSDDTSRLQIGKAFWGFYEITVPFQVKIGQVTFIPVNSTEMAAIDPETRQKIRDGLIKSSIYTEIINDFPFSGNLSILMSNYDYFPLEPDNLDAGYFWLNDTLYARTDTGDVPIIIDTLLLVELPPPEAFNSNGSVKTPGFTLAETPLDSAKMEAILRDETHYIRPRVHFNATKDFVIVGYYDEVRILAAISLTVETMELINNNNENETPATVP